MGWGRGVRKRWGKGWFLGVDCVLISSVFVFRWVGHYILECYVVDGRMKMERNGAVKIR